MKSTFRSKGQAFFFLIYPISSSALFNYERINGLGIKEFQCCVFREQIRWFYWCCALNVSGLYSCKFFSGVGFIDVEFLFHFWGLIFETIFLVRFWEGISIKFSRFECKCISTFSCDWSCWFRIFNLNFLTFCYNEYLF